VRAFEEVSPASRAHWRAWLARHHTRKDSVWLVHWKKTSGRQAFTMDEAVEEALCFGWIDSLPRAVDADRTKLLFSPRKAGSAWSAVNIARVEKLIAAGQMTPAGFAKIEAAKQDGSWDKLAGVNAFEIPPDLHAGFALHPSAHDQFTAFPPSVKRGILEWLGTAKTPATRAKRVAEIAAKAAIGERANQWRKARANSDPLESDRNAQDSD
jgi:uncharacterized protein YdeI (YjbR/CyaY-like superfamily)